jgi:hypothetical protein
VAEPADPQNPPKLADIQNPPELADIKNSVAQAAQAAISSGRLNLTDLMAIEIRELTAAFSALGAAEVGNGLLEDAQRDMLRQCSQNLERSLAKLGNALISGNDPEDLLKRLIEAANAATALEDTQSTLGPRAGRLDRDANQRTLIQNWFGRHSQPRCPDLTSSRSSTTSPRPRRRRAMRAR